MDTRTTYRRIITLNGRYWVKVTADNGTHFDLLDSNGETTRESHAAWFSRTRAAIASGQAVCR